MRVFLDNMFRLAVGAVLVLMYLKWVRGFDVDDEIILMNLVWPIALLAGDLLEKRSEDVSHG